MNNTVVVAVVVSVVVILFLLLLISIVVVVVDVVDAPSAATSASTMTDASSCSSLSSSSSSSSSPSLSCCCCCSIEGNRGDKVLRLLVSQTTDVEIGLIPNSLYFDMYLLITPLLSILQHCRCKYGLLVQLHCLSTSTLWTLIWTPYRSSV